MTGGLLILLVVAVVLGFAAAWVLCATAADADRRAEGFRHDPRSEHPERGIGR